MRILLIAHSFPPDPLVGSFRAAKVANAFRSAGHDVEVVTACLPGEWGPFRKIEPGFRVHTVRAIPNPRHGYVWAKSFLRSARGADSGADIRETPLSGRLSSSPAEPGPTWKRLILSALWTPDDSQGFVPPALARSLRIRRQGVDLIYTTAPPFSDHLVGLALKKLTGLPWVAEFRDPWSDNPEKSAEVQSRPTDAVNRWLERRCLEEADHVVAVAEATRELLAGKLPPESRAKVVTVLNGIDGFEAVPNVSLNGSPFRIVYAGSLQSGRDPRPFFRGLAKLKEERGLGASDLRVEFIGSNPTYHGHPIEAWTRKLGISELVEFLPWMPQEEARARMRSANLLLLLFRDQRIQIPNKLYDYLGAQRPILAMVDRTGEAARMLRAVGGHLLVFEDDPAAMREALETALDDRASAEIEEPDRAILLQWSTEQQMRRLLSVIGAAPASV